MKKTYIRRVVAVLLMTIMTTSLIPNIFTYASSEPYEFSRKYRWDDFENGVFDDYPGGVYKYRNSEKGGTIDESDGKANLKRNGESGSLELVVQANGDYPYDDNALLKFSLSKSPATDGIVYVHPNYLQLKWSGNKMSVAYRDNPDQSGEDVVYRELDGIYSDKVDVVIFANIKKSRFTLWLNGEAVLENKYTSNTNFGGSVGTPSKIQDIRLSSTSGANGEIFSIDDYETGTAQFDELKVDLDYEWLSYNSLSGGENTVWDDMNLPVIGKNGSEITWSSSDEAVISSDGAVNRPTGENATVVLTAKLEAQGVTAFKSFEYLVLQQASSTEDIVDTDCEFLTLDRISWQDRQISNLTLPKTGVFGSNITWTSKNEDIIANDGTIDRTKCNGIDTTVTLTARFEKDGYYKDKDFDVVVLAEDTTLDNLETFEYEDFSSELSDKWSLDSTGGKIETIDGVLKISRLENSGETAASMSLDSQYKGMVGFSALVGRPKGDNVTTRLEMNNGSKTYFWVTIKNDGSVEFLACLQYGQNPNFISAKKKMSGNSARISVWMDTQESSLVVYMDGEVISDKHYSYSTIDSIKDFCVRVQGSGPSEVLIDDLKIFKTLPSEKDRLKYDYEHLTIDQLSDEAAYGYVSKDLTLPLVGYSGSTITWTSNKTDIISNDGKVTLPVGLSEDPKVTLTATIVYGGARLRKSFSFYVIRSFETSQEKVEADYNYIVSNMDLVLSEDLDNITKSLNFNQRTRYGSTIEFESSDTSVITESGRVIRPRAGEADKPCTVTLRVSDADVVKEYSFDVVVKADESFVDPQFMSDEEFFGKYENDSWTVEGKFDYENTPELAKVEAAVKSGDYTLAKKELLEYSKVKKHSYTISRGNRDTLRSEAYIDRMDGAPDHNFREGVLYVDDTMGTYSASISRAHISPGMLTLKLMSWYNEASELEICSREGDIFNAAYLEMDINGVLARFEVSEDATIRSGKNMSNNYGFEDKLYSRTYGDFMGDETSQILLKFDLSSIPLDASISNVKLYVTGRATPTSSGTKKIMVAYELDSSWKENEVAWKSLNGMFYNFNQVGFDWEGPQYSDVEFMVQMCRFYPVTTVTAEYLYTGDEKYAYGLIRVIEEWLRLKAGETNGMNNDSSGVDDGRDLYMRGQYPRSLDTSERMENLSEIMFFIAKSEYMTPDTMTALYKHIWDMYEATSKNFANDAGNWQQNELTRVIRHADEFPEFSSSPEWQQIAVDNLSQFIYQHHYADGSYLESTCGYPGNALNQFIEFRKLAYESGLEVSEEFDDMLLDVAFYNNFLFAPDGRGVGWGDSGMGRVGGKSYKWADINEFIDDEEYKYVSTCGDSGTEPSWTSKVYDAGKIAFMRSSWSKDAMYMMTNVRGGGGHSHADDNHIFLMAHSQALLVDSGIGSYTSGTPQRTYCGDTIGHNTVEINGITQWNHAVPTQQMPGEINDFITNQTFDFIKSTAVSNRAHDHERNILFVKPYYVIVSDYLTPDDQNSTNSYKQLWHMVPEAKLSTDSEDLIIKSNFDQGANVLLASADDDATVETGDGYFDYSYNELYEIKHGYFYKKQAGDTTFDTVIVPNKNDKNATLDTERINIDVETTTATALKFTSKADGTTNNGYYYLSYEDVPAVRDFDKFETDGEMAFANENSDGNISIIALKNASYLKVEDEYVVKLDSKVDDLSIAVQGTELVVDSSETKLENIRISDSIKMKSLTVNGKATAFTKEDGFILINENGNVDRPSDNNSGGTLTGAPSDNADKEDSNNKNDKPSGGNGGNGGSGAVVPGGSLTPSQSGNFADVADSHWAKQAIEELYAKGVINGRAQNTYAPDDSVTRAEFIALITRSLGKDSVTYAGSFEDIASGDWYADSVETALSLGLISKDTNFRPNDSITREEMAKIIVGAAELGAKIELPEDFAANFADASAISDWALDYVAKAAYLELLKGDDKGAFNPKNNLTRAESAVVIHRFLK